jgi:lysozyme
MRVRGTDLAMFQGDPDFNALARDESLVFAIVKATEGQGYCDPKWERNLKLAPSAFEFVTCYHVLRGTSDGALHAGKQWERMAAFAAQARTHMLPAVIDFEITDKRAAEWLVDNAVKYRLRIEAITGLKPILYSYPNFLREQCADLAPDLLRECWHWPALYVGKKWADVAGGFDPYEWLRARKMLPAMWSHAPWSLYQYDGDKGEYYNGVDYDFNAAQSRDVLLAMAGVTVADTDPLPPPPDTQPDTPKSKSSDQWRFDLSSAVTPIRAGEGEHTPMHLRDDDEPKGAA